MQTLQTGTQQSLGVCQEMFLQSGVHWALILTLVCVDGTVTFI